MVFWFWVVVTMLVIPPVAWALGMGLLYLCFRGRLVLERGERPPG